MCILQKKVINELDIYPKKLEQQNKLKESTKKGEEKKMMEQKIRVQHGINEIKGWFLN